MNLSTIIEKKKDEFVEAGADLEHDRWARWQKYMFSKMVEEERFEEGSHFKTGNYILPKEFVDRWFRQIDTPYSELSEPEKESDREETRSYLPFLEKAIRESVEETLLEVRYEDRKAVDWRDIGSPELIAKQSEAYGYNQALDKIEGKVKEFMK